MIICHHETSDIHVQNVQIIGLFMTAGNKNTLDKQNMPLLKYENQQNYISLRSAYVYFPDNDNGQLLISFKIFLVSFEII